VGKPELGAKLTCTSCAARFYDLHRTPAVCPKCNAAQPPPKLRTAYLSRAAPRRWMSRGAPPAAAEPAADEAVAAVEVDDDLDSVDPPEVDEDDEDVVKPAIEAD
jgi:uncharacterized protein (TIGR02300 family)